jgi:hypothetical protein
LRTLVGADFKKPRRLSRARRPIFQTAAGQEWMGAAIALAAKCTIRRRTMESHERNGHLSGLIIVSKRLTRATSSPDSRSRRAISKATSPPKE